MPFIEYKNIENNINDSSSNYDWLWGVLVGFLLAFVQNEIIKFKQIKKLGEIFNFEINSLKTVYINQIESLRQFKKQIQSNSTESLLKLHLLKKLDTIRLLDRVELAKYFQKRKNKASLGYVSEILNNLEITYHVVLELEIIHRNYTVNLNLLLNDYIKNLQKLNFIIRKYSDYPPELKANDELIKLIDTFISNKNMNLIYILELKQNFHNSIRSEITIPTFIIDNVIDFNTESLLIISNIENINKNFIYSLENIETTIVGNFKNIYKEEMPL